MMPELFSVLPPPQKTSRSTGNPEQFHLSNIIMDAYTNAQSFC